MNRLLNFFTRDIDPRIGLVVIVGFLLLLLLLACEALLLLACEVMG